MTLDEKIAIVQAYGYKAEEAEDWYAKYLRKTHSAPNRGLAFELTFEQYLSKAIEAGIDEASQIGVSHGKFVLGRVGDAGDYTRQNCRFIPTEQNIQEAIDNGRYQAGGIKISLSKIGRTKENHAGTAEQAKKLAKHFLLIDPTGVQHRGSNVKEFCQSYGLNVFAVYDVFAGRRPHHRGWTGQYLE